MHTTFPVPSSAPMEHAQLSYGEQGVLLHAPASFGIPPSLLAKFPRSLADQMLLLCAQWLASHDRCLALLLLLDCRTWACTYGIPRQRVARDSVSWQAVREDFPKATPTTLVVGSFQFRRFILGEQSIDAVPMVDGVHLTVTADQTPMPIHTFLRVQGNVRRVPSDDVFVHDVHESLQVALPKIQLL